MFSLALFCRFVSFFVVFGLNTPLAATQKLKNHEKSNFSMKTFKNIDIHQRKKLGPLGQIEKSILDFGTLNNLSTFCAGWPSIRITDDPC